MGAYLLRAHWPEQNNPAKLWETYTQLTEAEAAFRTLKSEINVRPIWHWTPNRVEAHIMVAFLGYVLLVYLKKLLARRAPSLTPSQALQTLQTTMLVDVVFDTRDNRRILLPRITTPQSDQAALLLQLGWTLPDQPPPRISPLPQAPCR